MAKSLIRKNQLHPDIADLISGYGNDFFITNEEFNQLLIDNIVYTTGDQQVNGLKDFLIRPTVNGTGVLLIGEAAGGSVENVVYTTGIQTISDVKNFTSRPTFNNVGIATTGEIGSNSTAFEGTRPITLQVNGFTNLQPGGDNVVDFLNNLFYPFISPSITLNSFSVQELGTTVNSINFIGTLTTGSLNLSQITGVRAFINNSPVSSGNSASTSFNFPNTGNLGLTDNINNVRIKASGLNKNNSPVEISGTLQSIYFAAPSYAGSGIDNLQSNPANMKLVLSGQNSLGGNNGKTVMLEPSSRQITVTTNGFYYFVYPDSWGALSKISSVSPAQDFTISNDFVTGNVILTLANGSNYTYRYYKNSQQTILSNYGVIYTF